ncbi:hypothetical protein L4C31_02925 [Aliivibrio sifiae]
MITFKRKEYNVSAENKVYAIHESIRVLQDHHRKHGVQLYDDLFEVEEGYLLYDGFELAVVTMFSDNAICTQLNEYMCPKIATLRIEYK